MEKAWIICRCLASDRTWHKVTDPKADYSGDLGEGKVKNELRLEPCWSMLLIDPLNSMSNEPSYFLDPNLGPGTDAGL